MKTNKKESCLLDEIDDLLKDNNWANFSKLGRIARDAIHERDKALADLDKYGIASSLDLLIGRLPVGLRIQIDIKPPASGLPIANVSIGIPKFDGTLNPVGMVSTDFNNDNHRGDHILENAVHDAFENLRKSISETKKTNE